MWKELSFKRKSVRHGTPIRTDHGKAIFISSSHFKASAIRRNSNAKKMDMYVIIIPHIYSDSLSSLHDCRKAGYRRWLFARLLSFSSRSSQSSMFSDRFLLLDYSCSIREEDGDLCALYSSMNFFTTLNNSLNSFRLSKKKSAPASIHLWRY